MKSVFSNGAEWIRADFHLHTKEDKEFKYDKDNKEYYKDYIDKLEEENIKIGIITNHNKFNKFEFTNLKKEASKRGIFLIPGVELSVNDGANGIHTLIAFKEEDWICNGNDHINSFIGSAFLGKDNYENENGRCKFGLIETIKILNSMNKDYFIVMAHIEQNSGFYNELNGGRIEEIAVDLNFDNILGFQKVRTRKFVDNLKQWIGKDKLPAFVEGSDPKCIDEIGKGEKTFLKVGDFSFDAVKLALCDYENRTSKEEFQLSRPIIKSISFQGGKLEGKEIDFSPFLNTLIGIRGSGKSTILELLRYGLDYNFDGEIIDKNYKDNLIYNSIGSGGKISIDVIDIYGKKYNIERLYNHGVHITNEAGEELSISVDSLIDNVLYFGQKDLSVSKDGYEHQILDKLLGNSRVTVIKKIDDKANELVDRIREWNKISNTQDKIEELNTNISNYEYKLNLYKELGIENKLDKQVEFKKDGLHLKNSKKAVNDFYTNLMTGFQDKKAKIEGLLSYESKYNQELNKETNNYITAIIQFINKISEEVDKIKSNEELLKNKYDEFKKLNESLEEEFADIKRKINIPNINPDEFVTISTKLEETKNEKENLNKLKSQSEELKNKINKVIKELNDLWLEDYKLYENKITKINESQKELKIEIKFKDNKAHYKNDLKEKLKGTGIRDNIFELIVNEYADYLEIFRDVYLGKNEFSSKLSPANYSKFIEKFEANFEDWAKYKTPNTINIYYHNKPLHEHSIGQRASALLLFLLTQEDNNLIIIDQPEDDLDNQIIYKELITKIKEMKPQVQFIFATHNANIPVLGDAEQVISCKYSDKSINFNFGSIDKSNIRENVVNIMEGGKEAFRRRNEIYKLWNC
ncbi:TrlF family AAA-like ATPase [Candidatus Clostridium stratigraminis]|uniref:TrlF family AAA-like ATPase n=1 Tax=Candidatus Clostridium stratigraminis TaxID=3381661 RepID=A0ABW8TBP0_9CLOT